MFLFHDTCVQVQVPLPHTCVLAAVDPDNARAASIMVYNCKRTVDFLIARDKCPDGYAAIEAVVCDPAKNIPEQLGRKAYLRAMCFPDGKVTIDCRESLPPENW